jgi:hypothetical protein
VEHVQPLITPTPPDRTNIDSVASVPVEGLPAHTRHYPSPATALTALTPAGESRAARPRIAAGALFTDTAGRVLLVRPTYKPHCDIPGEYVERDESPLSACSPEIREELGITPIANSQTFVID